MARRKTLSDIAIAALKPRAARYAFPDPELSGHFIRVTPSGAKSYCAVARDPVSGRQVWATIGPCDLKSVAQAREEARAAIKRIRAGMAPFEPLPPRAASFSDIGGQYIQRHVIANKLRSRGEIERVIGKYISPAWGDRDFKSIRRSDVVALLDRVEDEHGATQADAVLAIFSGIANWFAARHDDYTPPLARGMRRTDPKTRKRARILADDELRAVWRQAETAGTFGDLIRLLLLTAQRRERVVSMRWADIDDGEWLMPSEARAKGVGGALVLPASAIDIIQARSRISGNPFVLAGRGDGHLNSFSKSKAAFDSHVPITAWTLHDLRRTARSLMSRAGVRPDIAERTLGHVIAGVEGTYDRHLYRDEKADALRRLAALIETIVNPPAANVVHLREAIN